MELVPSEETSDVQIQDLKSNRIDVGIALAPIEEPGLSFARQMQTIISIVSTGLGIVLIPSALTKLKREGVTFLEVREQSPRITLGVVYRSKDTNSAVLNFIELAIRSSAQLSGRKGGVTSTSPRR